MRHLVRAAGCHCEDYPCCTCGSDEVLTGQDAIDAAREQENLMYADDDLDEVEPDEEPDPFLTDAEADGDALASAGMGTDEDYESETPLGQQLDGGCDPY